jgi:tetratricopeptide (TPR) repeat protein
MKFNSLKFAAMAALLAGACGPALAIPDGPIANAAPATPVAPDAAMSARLAYNLAYEDFEKARADEAASATLTGAKRKAADAKVMEAFTRARAKFEEAAKADPNMKEAWNLIGYTNRRLGAYDASLAAYEKALALNPQYTEAIEYRAEAYLALNRIDDAKAAYMTLFAESRAHATVLMQSMQNWVAVRRKQPAGLAAADIDSFAQWVEERAAVARQTASLDTDRTVVRSWN